MEVFDQFISPVELTGMIRAAEFDLTENRFKLSQLLPHVTIADVSASFLVGQQGLAEASVYRTWNTEAPIGRRESLSRATFNFAPLGEKMMLDEYHSMRVRRLNASNSEMGDALEGFIARDVQRLARNIGARLEIARGDALFNGRVTINENGIFQVLDFGRAAEASNYVAPVLWTNYENSKPIDNLLDLVKRFNALNGEDPDQIWMPKSIYLDMVQSVQIRNQVFQGAITTAPLINNAMANSALAAFDLPPIVTYDATTKVVNDDGQGVVTRITPPDKILLTAPGDPMPGEGTSLGGTFLGITPESQLPEYGLQPADQPGIVAANWYTKDPVNYWTHAAALGLPVLRDPNLAYVAKVV